MHINYYVSRIALESAVYSSECIVVGDEIMAVNLVDVTRMSLDDVVIIMSIPRRLVLTTRRQKQVPRYATHARTLDHKPAPVVVFKGDPDQPEFGGGFRGDYRGQPEAFGSPGRRGGELQPPVRDSRTLTWDRNPKPDRSDPKYFPVNSLPRQRVPNTALSPPRGEWRGEEYREAYPPSGGRDVYTPGSRDMPPPMHALPSYQPPPPVVTEQPRTAKEPTHFKPYKHAYNGVQGKMGPLGPGLGGPVGPPGGQGLMGPGFRDEADLYSPAYSADNPRADSALGRIKHITKRFNVDAHFVLSLGANNNKSRVASCDSTEQMLG